MKQISLGYFLVVQVYMKHEEIQLWATTNESKQELQQHHSLDLHVKIGNLTFITFP